MKKVKQLDLLGQYLEALLLAQMLIHHGADFGVYTFKTTVTPKNGNCRNWFINIENQLVGEQESEENSVVNFHMNPFQPSVVEKNPRIEESHPYTQTGSAFYY